MEVGLLMNILIHILVLGKNWAFLRKEMKSQILMTQVRKDPHFTISNKSLTTIQTTIGKSLIALITKSVFKGTIILTKLECLNLYLSNATMTRLLKESVKVILRFKISSSVNS